MIYVSQKQGFQSGKISLNSVAVKFSQKAFVVPRVSLSNFICSIHCALFWYCREIYRV